MDRIVKTIAPTMCPHCSKEFLVSFRTMAPSIDWALKPESIATVKENLKSKVEKLDFKDPKEKESVLAWIGDENVMFGPEESDLVLDQIKRDYVK